MPKNTKILRTMKVRLMLAAGCCATIATSGSEPPRIEDTRNHLLDDDDGTTQMRVRLNPAARNQAARWFIELEAWSEQAAELKLVPEFDTVDRGQELTLRIPAPAHPLNAAGATAIGLDADEDSGAADVDPDAGAAGAVSASQSARAWGQLELSLAACQKQRACELPFRIERITGGTAPIHLTAKSWAHRPIEDGGCLSVGSSAPEFTSEARVEVTFDE